jgi:hypothetical protein
MIFGGTNQNQIAWCGWKSNMITNGETMWLVIWKDADGVIHTDAFDNKCDCEKFYDHKMVSLHDSLLYVMYDARA